MSGWKASGLRPSAGVVAKRFGGWVAACELAGVQVSAASMERRERLRARGQRLRAGALARMRGVATDGMVSATEWDRRGLRPRARNIARMFGSWRRAGELAGVAGRGSWRREKILQELRRWCVEQGQTGTMRGWRAAGKEPGTREIVAEFGSWRAAWRAALAGLMAPD